MSSTSMFVSCKDYDDDINNVSDRVTVLEAAKVDLENKIATLRADLEANYATKVALADTAFKERARALAAEATLSTRIQTAQEGVDMLNALIGGDISKSEKFSDCKTYKAALEKTWSKIESVETGLGARLSKLESDLNLDNPESKIRVYLQTLENQVAALEAWKSALDADGGAATKNWVGKEIAEAEGRAAIDAATKAAKALSDSKAYTDAQLAEKIAEALKTAAADAQKKADAAQAAAIEAAAKDATKKADAAEAAAKLYAAQEAKAKADAAQAAAEAYAKTYAEKMRDEAKTFATSEAEAKAAAAEAAAKAYADGLLEQAKKFATSEAAAKAAEALATAKGYTDEEVAKAKAAAIDAAVSAAKLYTDQQIAAAEGRCKTYAENMRDEAKTYTNEEIEKLKNNELKKLSDRIDGLQDQLNVLDMIAKELRSLVFIPEFYYCGIEAMTIHTLNFQIYTWMNGNTRQTIPAANADTKEKVGYVGADVADFAAENVARTTHARYDSVSTDPKSPASRVLNFVAKYHMNPSSANLSNVKKIEILDADRNYVTRSSEAVLSCDPKISAHTWKDGILSVNVDVKDLSKVKRIYEDGQVTTFATQVTLRNDTTITSDYAAVYKDTIKDLRLAHTNLPLWSTEYSAEKGYVATTLTGKTGGYIFNKHCGKCTKDNATSAVRKSHLMATVEEAAKFAPQDSVDWNKTLDLSSIVELHYTNTAKTHAVMTDDDLAANGLSFKYELTAYYVGTTGTSESAQAAIKDGILRPQMPKTDGTGAAYEATEQNRSTIGRTPIVRVSLVDAKGNVLDYGYIRIKITETKDPIVDPTKPVLSITYTGNPYSWSYTGECTLPEGDTYSIETSWIQTQYDIYAEFMAQNANLSLSREEFEAIYKTNGVNYAIPAPGTVASQNDLDQYNPKTWEKLTTKIGKVACVNELNSENGQITSTLKWTMTKAEARNFFVKNPGLSAEAKDISNCPGVAVLYEAKVAGYPNFFVVFKAPGNATVTVTKPSATVAWDAKKINENWFDTNSNVAGSGKKETHAQTLTPEDYYDAVNYNIAKDLDTRLSDIFNGNNIGYSYLTDLVVPANGDFGESKIKFKFIFDPKNNGLEYAGLDGKTYVTRINPTDSLELQAGEKVTPVANIVYKTIAKIKLDGKGQGINHQVVAWVHDEPIAQVLLNKKSHNDLAGQVNAYIGIKAIGKCDDLPLNYEPFAVRFLRPINVTKVDPEAIEDANQQTLQVINLRDLVNLTDWRDRLFDTRDWGYYDIQKIEILGASNNTDIYDAVQTNLNQTSSTSFVKLSSVNSQIELTYAPKAKTSGSVTFGNADSYGTLTYKNMSNPTADFDLKFKVKVTYYWGYVLTEDIVLHVKKTTGGNAARLSK